MVTYTELDRINWQRAQRGQPRLNMAQAEAALRTPAGTISGNAGGEAMTLFLVGLALLPGVTGEAAVPANPPADPPANAGNAGQADFATSTDTGGGDSGGGSYGGGGCK